jgi:hypothetical protein
MLILLLCFSFSSRSCYPIVMQRPTKSRLRKTLKWHHEQQRRDSLTRRHRHSFVRSFISTTLLYIICLAVHTTVVSILRNLIPLIRGALRSHAHSLNPSQSHNLFFKNRKIDFTFRKLRVMKLNVGLR